MSDDDRIALTEKGEALLSETLPTGPSGFKPQRHEFPGSHEFEDALTSYYEAKVRQLERELAEANAIVEACHVAIDKRDLGPSRAVSFDGGKTWEKHSLQFRLGIVLDVCAKASEYSDRAESAEAEVAALKRDLSDANVRQAEMLKEIDAIKRDNARYVEIAGQEAAALDAAVLSEREACARICDLAPNGRGMVEADAIRARAAAGREEDRG